MNWGKQELLLKMFVKNVELGKIPPKAQLELVAEGIKQFLKDGKPWQKKTGRKGRANSYHTQNAMLCAYLLNKIGCSKPEIVNILKDTESGRENLPADTTWSYKTLLRYIEDGEALAKVWSSGEYLQLFAIEQLLTVEALKPSHKKELLVIKQELEKEEEEPNYD